MTTFHQRTRVLVVVDSHGASESIELSRDVLTLNVNKQTKTMGKWQMQLAPRRNYLNIVHPNDVINIYIDPGDGKSGFIRTMFGFVDRVERSEVTKEKGDTSTRYTLIGSDFQKAVDKTSIYFNNYMRQILDERFARSDQGRLRTTFRNDAAGSVMRNAGLTAFGTPADFVENFLMILLGFGQQWRLPSTYSRAQEQISMNREKRIQRAKERIPQLVIDALSKFGRNPQALRLELDDILTSAAKESKLTDAELTTAESVQRRDAAVVLNNNPALLAYRSTLDTADGSYPNGVLDLLSFDFIEALTIDGFQANASIWQGGNQTLGQFLYGNSNGIINELIFDLRPVSESSTGSSASEGGLEEGGYSRSDDELRINTGGSEQFTSPVAAVKYQPAVVFREFPYSVVEGIDLSALATLPPASQPTDAVSVDAISGGSVPAANPVDNSQVFAGFIPFGPVFTQRVNQEGRVIFKYPEPLHPAAKAFFGNAQARKHLDVVVITNDEVVTANIGRSDEDVQNLFQMSPRSSANMAIQMRSVLTNFTPVVNQVSIARHGLRSWEGQTQFANYSKKNVAGVVGGSADNSQIRRNLVRWQLLMDHWFQHNIEYLSGTITMRSRPDIRVGYRLDWEDRNESYYVEGVQHQWAYPGAMQTTLSVSRGQRNDPFPAYIPPVFINDAGETVQQVSGNRGEDGRLGQFFHVLDTQATAHSTEGEGPHEADNGPNRIDQFPTILDNGGIAVVAGTSPRGVDPEYGNNQVGWLVPSKEPR